MQHASGTQFRTVPSVVRDAGAIHRTAAATSLP